MDKSKEYIEMIERKVALDFEAIENGGIFYD